MSSSYYKLNGLGYMSSEPPKVCEMNAVLDNVRIDKSYNDLHTMPLEYNKVKLGEDGYLHLEDSDNNSSQYSFYKIDVFNSKEYDDIRRDLKSPKEVLSNDDFLKMLKETMLNILTTNISGNRDIVRLCTQKVLSTYTGIDVNGSFCLIGTDSEYIENTLRENAKEFFLGNKEFYRCLTRILVMCGIYYPSIQPYISEIMDEFASVTKSKILKEI